MLLSYSISCVASGILIFFIIPYNNTSIAHKHHTNNNHALTLNHPILNCYRYRLSATATPTPTLPSQTAEMAQVVVAVTHSVALVVIINFMITTSMVM